MERGFSRAGDSRGRQTASARGASSTASWPAFTRGWIFARHTGTPVHAGNSGVVVLARPLYYEGNCVAIDHGLGLYTISMHLSRIDVHEGRAGDAGAAHWA